MVPYQLLILGACLHLLHTPTVGAWIPSKFQTHHKNNLDRRGALGKLVSLTTGIFTFVSAEVSNPNVSVAEPTLNLPILQNNDEQNAAVSTAKPSASAGKISTKTPTTARTFDAYFITPDETSVRSKLDKVDSQKFLKNLASKPTGGAIFLGEHHNSAADHDFQATFIEQVYKQRQKQQQQNKHNHMAKMAIGLEQIQQEFQPVLDSYIGGKISLERMRFMVQWEKRWTWSFDNYKKIFETAKSLSIPLLALNVDSEDLSLVEKAGYPGLPTEKLRKYIKDP
jgi:hypothetical protein